MHLFITAAPVVPWEEKQAAIDAAVRIVSELMGPNDLPSNVAAEAPAPPPVPVPMVMPTPVIMAPPSVATVPALVRGAEGALAFAALESAPASFDAVGKLRGVDGAHLDYFSGACPGVSASVRGQGTGASESMTLHVCVEWIGDGCGDDNKQKRLDEAARLAAQLVASVRADYEREVGVPPPYLPSQVPPPPPLAHAGHAIPPRAPPGVAPPPGGPPRAPPGVAPPPGPPPSSLAT